MLFSSLVFMFYFFPVALAGYYLLKWKRSLQNVWLFIVSILFYAWGEPKNVLLMLTSILVNGWFGLLIEKHKEKQTGGRNILFLSCSFNIGMLFVFKYLGFVVKTFNEMSKSNFLPEVNIALPIGISFFTFQAMSYVIDVYFGKTKAEKNLLYVGLYISFFPQLIAGPIIQYSDVAEQIRTRQESVRKFSVGISRFVMGLGKKILLANQFAILADYIFNWSKIGYESYAVPASLAWLGAVAYTLQIFFDFSAYSDMAIGLGLVFGFQFKENFNYPYIAVSISDFWKRWHISLTSWFREYIYFPLGGSRVANKDTMVRNMLVVWILTGIWHGAQWTFLVWGLMHFLFQLGERFLEIEKKKIPIWIRHGYTMFIIIIGWVIFRSDDLYQAGTYIKNMFGLNYNGFYSSITMMFLREYGIWFLIGAIFCTPVTRKINNLLAEGNMGKAAWLYNITYPAAMLLLFLISVCYLAMGAYNPFIYFNF